MRLTHTDLLAPAYEVYFLTDMGPCPVPCFLPWWEHRRRTRRPWKVSACTLADEEAGLVEVVLLGPNWEGGNDWGIGYDAPVPPPEALPYGMITGRLVGTVELRARVLAAWPP